MPLRIGMKNSSLITFRVTSDFFPWDELYNQKEMREKTYTKYLLYLCLSSWNHETRWAVTSRNHLSIVRELVQDSNNLCFLGLPFNPLTSTYSNRFKGNFSQATRRFIFNTLQDWIKMFVLVLSPVVEKQLRQKYFISHNITVYSYCVGNR